MNNLEDNTGFKTSETDLGLYSWKNKGELQVLGDMVTNTGIPIIQVGNSDALIIRSNANDEETIKTIEKKLEDKLPIKCICMPKDLEITILKDVRIGSDNLDIRCDECNEKINTESVKIVDKWIGDGVRRKFFRCPKCGCEYTIAYTDGKIRELSKKDERDYENHG